MVNFKTDIFRDLLVFPSIGADSSSKHMEGTEVGKSLIPKQCLGIQQVIFWGGG